jgi:hypothetical protein
MIDVGVGLPSARALIGHASYRDPHTDPLRRPATLLGSLHASEASLSLTRDARFSHVSAGGERLVGRGLRGPCQRSI